MRNHKVRGGRAGSLSRSLRYHERMENEPEFAKKQREKNKREFINYKKKKNKRCIDCKKLINPSSTRCRSCRNKKIRECTKSREKTEVMGDARA